MIKFGTGGWRALIGDEFTKFNITRLAQAMSDYIWKNSKDEEQSVVIGYDRRFLSKTAAIWVVEVFAANNIKVNLINEEAPTPMTMFTIGDLGLEYGIAVTASHNAYEWNGIKFFFDGGKDATVEVTNELEKMTEKIAIEDVKSMRFEEAKEKGLVVIINPLNSYIDRIMSLIDVEAIKKRDLRILLDPMHGVSRIALQALLINCRCRLDAINDSHDMMFGGNMPSPSRGNLQRLKELVVKGGYDLGVATDGDADRIGLISERGRYIHANDILVLLYYYYLEYKGERSAVVRNISTTHLLDRIAKAYGQECIEVPVGFKHITKGMEDSGAIIGGESSGGLATVGHIKGKDGIYAAALIIEMLSLLNKSLSDILDEIYEKFGQLFTVERNFRVTEEHKEEIRRLLFTESRLPDFKHKIEKVSDKDGLKVYFENDGWILVRFSGTEPVIRIYSEMDSIEEAALICDRIQEFLKITPSMETE